MKALPIGVQDFEVLRTSDIDCIYVDNYRNREDIESIKLTGINFNTDIRNIDEWIVEEG